MSDREYIHPMALKVLTGNHPGGREEAVKDWRVVGIPFLTPSASAVLRAVEEMMVLCNTYVPGGQCELCGYDTPCNLKTIRAAWKGEDDGA